MKKSITNKKKILIILVVSFCVFLGIINRNSHIRTYIWKSNSANKISIIIKFNERFDIHGKDIILGKQYCGTILLCLQKYLIVTNAKGELCLYSNKGKLNQN